MSFYDILLAKKLELRGNMSFYDILLARYLNGGGGGGSTDTVGTAVVGTAKVS